MPQIADFKLFLNIGNVPSQEGNRCNHCIQFRKQKMGGRLLQAASLAVLLHGRKNLWLMQHQLIHKTCSHTGIETHTVHIVRDTLSLNATGTKRRLWRNTSQIQVRLKKPSEDKGWKYFVLSYFSHLAINPTFSPVGNSFSVCIMQLGLTIEQTWTKAPFLLTDNDETVTHHKQSWCPRRARP